MASRRLMQEMRRLAKIAGGCRKAYAFEAAPVDDACLLEWEVRLFYESDSLLGAGLHKRQLDHLLLRMVFTEAYPMSPPLVYVVRPKLKKHTGFVMNGGGVCMELLTPEGWSPATTIEALVMSVRAMLEVGRAELATASMRAREADYTRSGAERDNQHILAVHLQHSWLPDERFRSA